MWTIIAAGLLAAPAIADTELQAEGTTNFGGNQAAHAATFGNGLLNLAGSEAGKDALFLRYALPAADPPRSSFIWADKPATAYESSTTVSDLAAGAEGLYAAGSGMVKAGKKAGKQWSGLLAKFPADGTSPLWTARSEFFPDEKDEAFRAVASVVENGATVVYAAGHAASSEDNYTAVLSKYDAQGALLWSKTLGDPGDLKKSAGTGMVVAGGHIYVAGFTHHDSEKNAKFSSMPVFAALWKCDPQGNALWMQSASTALRALDDENLFSQGIKVNVAASDGFLYLVASKKGGKKSPGDIQFLKYDADGNLIWENGWDVEMPEEHLKANSVWALGLAAGKDRLYAAGFVKYTDKLHPGKDDNILVLEVDKEYGAVLAVHFHGERDRIENAFSIAADDRDVYAAGTVLARFSKRPVTPVGIDIVPGSAQNLVDPDETVADPDSPKKKKPQIPKKIEVAILSSGDFNAATMVDLYSLTFGRSGSEASWSGCSVQDVDQNGSADLLCQFDPRWTPWKDEVPIFKPGDKQGVLRGQLLSGGRFEGNDAVALAGDPVPEPALPPAPPEPMVSQPPPAPEPEPSPEPIPSVEPVPSPEPVVEPAADPAPAPEPAPPAQEIPPVEQPPAPPPTLAPPTTVSASTPTVTPAPAPAKAYALTHIPISPAVLAENASKTPVPTQAPASSPDKARAQAAENLIRRSLYSGESSRDGDNGPSVAEADETYATTGGRPTDLAIEYGKLAKASLKKGRTAEAISYYREALQLDPELPGLRRDLGLLLMEEDRLDEAAEHLKEALKLDPEDAEAREALDRVNALSEADRPD